MVSLLAGVSLVALILSVVLLYWHFLGYPLLMSRLSRRSQPRPPISDLPSMSVVLPVYNEARNIPSRVENLLAQEYPMDRLEIIVVESGSEDSTLAVAQDLARQCRNLKVVDQGARLGKASAVAAGKAVAEGSIIVVSDANTQYASRTLWNLAQPFQNPAVGGVGGRFVPRNTDDPSAAGSSLYWSLEEVMRKGEAALDSCCTFHGEVYAWRRDLVDPDRTAILDDFDSAIQIRKKGYRVDYAPEAVAYESVPTRMRDMATQWRKNALGAIQIGFRNLRFLVGVPSYYTYLIFPSHKGLQVLQPFLLALALLSLVTAVATGLGLVVLLVVVIVGALSAGTMAALLPAIRSASKSKGGTRFHAAAFLRTFLAFQYATLLGWKDYLVGKRDVRWEKVESTRT